MVMFNDRLMETTIHLLEFRMWVLGADSGLLVQSPQPLSEGLVVKWYVDFNIIRKERGKKDGADQEVQIIMFGGYI